MQIWVVPRERGLKPRWEQRQFASAEREGKLLPVVSSGDVAGTLKIDQDAQIYVSALPAGGEVTHQTQIDRKVYIFVHKGEVEVNGATLASGDQGRIAKETSLTIKAAKDSELILLDLPELRP